MARIIAGSTGQSVYVEVLEEVRRRGRRRPSRNGPTYNLNDVVIALESPYDALPVGVGRGVNRKVAAVEALQLIGGFSDPDWAVRHVPALDKFRESDGTFYGAYGERIGDQLAHVIRKLRQDRVTRQAVITLWNPARDNEPDRLDYPCTIAIGFSISDGLSSRLDMRVQMRSNDAWLGLPYDLFQFSQLQFTIANVLDIDVGTYTHSAWSLHLYEENFADSYNVTERLTNSVLREFQPRGIGLGLTVADVWRQARVIAATDRFTASSDVAFNESERWYVDVLGK